MEVEISKTQMSNFVEQTKIRINYVKTLNGVNIKVLISPDFFNKLSWFLGHHSWAFEEPIKPELKIGDCPVRPINDSKDLEGVLLFKNAFDNKSNFINIVPQ